MALKHKVLSFLIDNKMSRWKKYTYNLTKYSGLCAKILTGFILLRDRNESLTGNLILKTTIIWVWVVLPIFGAILVVKSRRPCRVVSSVLPAWFPTPAHYCITAVSYKSAVHLTSWYWYCACTCAALFLTFCAPMEPNWKQLCYVGILMKLLFDRSDIYYSYMLVLYYVATASE